MAKTDKVFDGSIPEIYDTHMVPLVFEGYAQGMADLVGAENPVDVLEAAAGSGVVTSVLAPKLTAGARYVIVARC